MINFMLPGLYRQRGLNAVTLGLLKDHPEYFLDNMTIYCAYGSLPHNIWDGGRINDIKQISIEEVKDTIGFYHDQNVRCRLVCTNAYLEEKHLDNRFMNLVLEQLSSIDEIVTASPLLESYLQKNYPYLGLISSTTKRLNSFDLLNNELKENKYRFVCLDYDLNSKLDQLKWIDHKEKCELLINEICGPGCPNRKEHYRLNAIHNLNYGKPYNLPDDCRIKFETVHPTTKHFINTIDAEKIINIYEPMGFSYFKIQGRTWDNITSTLSYADILVKDEYKLFYSDIVLHDLKNSGKINN